MSVNESFKQLELAHSILYVYRVNEKLDRYHFSCVHTYYVCICCNVVDRQSTEEEEEGRRA